MKKIKLLTLLVALILPFGVFAEDVPYKQEVGSIEVDYYNDSSKKVPVEGSTWRLFKVADIDTPLYDDTADALKITSLISDFEINGETEPEDVLEQFNYKKINESTLEISNVTKKGNTLEYFDEKTDKDGKAVFKDLEYGVYFGVEIKAARYHLISTPFLVSVPNTKDGTESTMDVVVEPKAIMGGDLTITKKLSGNNTNKDTKWDMQITLPKGDYRYEISNGEKGTVKSGDKLSIKGDEKITIFDILSGENYEVKEIQENQDRYQTKYDNQKNKINYAAVQDVVVTNTRNWDYNIVDSGDYFERLSNGDPLAIGIVITAAILIISGSYLVFKKKNK